LKNKDIPKELLEKRQVLECNFVLSLYKDMSLMNDYSNIVNGEDLITEDGQFYYGILQGMKKAGFNSADNMSIYTYLEDKKTLKDGWERRGGSGTVKEITNLLSLNNIDAYYDDLVKDNLLIRLHQAGFNVLNKLDKFKEMSSNEVYAYYEYQLSNIAVGKIEKLHAEDLTQGYDEWIEEWDKGASIGFKVGSPMLNYRLLGVHRSNLLLHLASIGKGKTSSAIAWYILPAIETQDVVVIANEQGVSEWRQMILSTVLFNKIGKVDGFSRRKMMVGGFTEEHKKKMKEAAEWLEKQPGKILFLETQDYGVENIKKLMSKYAAIGCSYFIIDTLKPENDASDKAWGEFSEVAKGIFLQAKKLDVAAIATCQLSPEAMTRIYLDMTCIGKAKAIGETATQVVMLRPITSDEKTKVKPYNYDGKIRKIIDLNDNKDYIMVFTPKNRFGEEDPQIVMERNLNFNTYKDVGWYECPFDQFRTR